MTEPTPENRLKSETLSLREKLYIIIFGTDTPAGKAFDLILIYTIIISVVAVALDSVAAVNQRFGDWLYIAEWGFTIAFTIEYLVRIYCSPQPLRYMRSFFGLVDLLSILPTYIAFFVPGSNYLLTIRIMRVLRIFRILKLIRYLSEANILMRSLFLARRKIFVFLSFVLALTTIFGSIMFVVEGPENGFTSIPKSVYWAIVTITTVGYGDVAPQTAIGQAIAAMTMITGYSVIAVPTGIITAELATEMQRSMGRFACKNCERSGHDADAQHCKYCGAKLFS
jgi:voltage-gated potassium channel